MSLNLGTLLVGLNVNTAPMRRAAKEIEDFTRTVDKMVRTSDDPRIAGAFQKQERAVIASFTKVAQLQQQLRDLGSQPQNIAKLTQAFQRYSATMRSGALDALEFNRAQDKLKMAMASTGQTLRELRNHSHGAEKGSRNMLKHIRDLESASVLAVGPLSGIGARIRALASITSRGSLGVAAFFGAMTAGIVIMSNMVKGAIAARQEFEKITVAFEAALGSTQAANAEFQFVVETTREMGIALQGAARNYARLNAAAANTRVTQEELRQLFRGVAAAASVFNLEGQELEGVMRALEQMMSKGIVSSDELRRQFALRIPGAMKIAADAMGVTEQQFNRMLARGEILAVDLLPKLGKKMEEVYGEQALIAADNMESSIQNLRRETFLFSLELDTITGLSKIWQSAIDSATKAVRSLGNNLKFIVPVVVTLGAVFAILTAKWLLGLRIVVAFWKPLTSMGTALKAAGKGASGFANFLSRLNTLLGTGALVKWMTSLTTLATIFIITSKGVKDTEEAIRATLEALEGFEDITADASYADLRKLNAELKLAESQVTVVSERLVQQQARVRELAIEYAEMRDASQQSEIKVMSFSGAKEVAQLLLVRRALVKANDGLNAMTAHHKELRDAIDATIAKAKEMNLELDSLVPLSNEAERALGAMLDQLREWENLANLSFMIDLGINAENIQYLQDLNAAMDMLKDVHPSEWDELSKTLGSVGDAADTLTSKLIYLIQKRREYQAFIQETIQAFDRGKSTLKTIEQDVLSLTAVLEASSQGPSFFQNFLEMKPLNDQVERWREILLKAKIDADEVNRILGEYISLRTQANAAEERQKDFAKQQQDGKKAFEDLNDELAEFNVILQASLGTQDEFSKFLESRELNKRLESLRSGLEAYGLTLEEINSLFAEFSVKATAAANLADFGRQAAIKQERYQKALADAGQQMDDLNMRTQAMSGSLRQWHRNQELLERNQFLNKFMAGLIAANVPFREAVALTWEMAEALDLNNEAVKRMEVLENFYTEMRRGIERAFDDIGQAITQAFVRGEDAAISFRSVVSGVIVSIMQQITKMAIINPLMNAILGSFSFGTPTPTPVPAAGGPGAFAKGGLFGKHGVQKFAKGGVVNSPTYFGSGSGMGLMGEAGPEAIMPLKRLSSGRLGVETTGATTTIIIEGDNIDARNMTPDTLVQLLPLLKQRDEKLKNEIMTMQHRGR